MRVLLPHMSLREAVDQLKDLLRVANLDDKDEDAIWTLEHYLTHEAHICPTCNGAGVIPKEKP